MNDQQYSNVAADEASRPAIRSEIAELRALLPAQVVAPGDAQYDAARAIIVDVADSQPAASALGNRKGL